MGRMKGMVSLLLFPHPCLLVKENSSQSCEKTICEYFTSDWDYPYLNVSFVFLSRDICESKLDYCDVGDNYRFPVAPWLCCQFDRKWEIAWEHRPCRTPVSTLILSDDWGVDKCRRGPAPGRKSLKKIKEKDKNDSYIITQEKTFSQHKIQ